MSEEGYEGQEPYEIPVEERAYASHGSAVAIPALLERIFFSGENVREGIRMSMKGEPHIDPFTNWVSVMYYEVYAYIRSDMDDTQQETVEKAFKEIMDIIREVMKKPAQRTLEMTTNEIYSHLSIKVEKLWFTLNAFIQGEKGLMLRKTGSKGQRFENDIKAMKKDLGISEEKKK